MVVIMGPNFYDESCLYYYFCCPSTTMVVAHSGSNTKRGDGISMPSDLRAAVSRTTRVFSPYVRFAIIASAFRKKWWLQYVKFRRATPLNLLMPPKGRGGRHELTDNPVS